jgi:hypothetical protein
MNKLIAVTLLLLLTACTKPVYIASGCPKIILPAKPHYPTESLRKGDSAATVAKATVLTIRMMQAREKEFMIRCGERCVINDR